MNAGLIVLVGLEGPRQNFTRECPTLHSDVLPLQTGGEGVDPGVLMPDAGVKAFQRHFVSQWSQRDFNMEVFFCKMCLIFKPAGYHSLWHNGYCCNS